MAEQASKIETNNGTIHCEEVTVGISLRDNDPEGFWKEDEVVVNIPKDKQQEFFDRIQTLVVAESKKFCNDVAIENSVAPHSNS